MVSWLPYALLFPFLYALCNVIDKFLLEKKIQNMYALGVFSGLLIFLSALGVWIVRDVQGLSTKVFFLVYSQVQYSASHI